MTLPAFIAAGTASATSVAWPAGHAIGDFAICALEHPTGTITTPSGWAIVPGFPVVHEVTSVILSAFYRVATSTSESDFAITGAADHNWGQICTYSGVNSLNPFHLVSGCTNITAVTQSSPGCTTLLQDCLIVGLLAWALDSAGPLISAGPTNGDLGSVTTRSDSGTTTGNGGGVIMWDGTLANKLAFSETAMTLSSSSATCVATLALQAADQTFGQRSLIVNNRRHSMPILVNQSTAQEFEVLMCDSADGKTGKTGLTPAWTLRKNAETSLSSISPTTTEIGSGRYTGALTTTHMNTLGITGVRVTGTNADPADCPNCIDVVAVDKQSATRGFAGTALPAVAAEAAGGLYTRGTGAGQIKQSANGQVDANLATWNLNGTSASTTVPKAMTAAGLVQASDGSGNAVAPASATTDIQGRLPAALTGAGNMKSDVLAISGDTDSADNLELMTDGTGYVADTAPAQMQQVRNIGQGSAAINLIADSRTVVTGTETGTLANTNANDGTYWNIADVAGTLEVTVDFDTSQIAGGVATALSWIGYVVGAVNTIKVFARNWGGASWDQIGSIVGIAGTVESDEEFELTNAHTDAGVARVRFQATGLTAATLKTDYLLLGVTSVAPTAADIAAAVSGGDVNVASMDANVIERATFAQDAKDVLGEARRFTAAGGSTTTVVFDAGASALDDFYCGFSLLCVGGTGVGQVASIPTTPGSYVGATKVATLDHTVGTAFDATSVFELRAAGGGGSGAVTGTVDANVVSVEAGAVTYAALDATLAGALGIVRRDTAQAGGGAAQLVLDASASATDDAYNGYVVYLDSGTGAKQERFIQDYDGTTKIATIDRAWETNPDGTTVFVIASGRHSAYGSAKNLLETVVENDHALGDLIRLMAGVLAGPVADFETDTLEFKSLDGSKIRVTITTSDTGRDASAIGDLTQ